MNRYAFIKNNKVTKIVDILPEDPSSFEEYGTLADLNNDLVEVGWNYDPIISRYFI